ncbi:protein split ends isoform X3 [Euwallacea fornicatus]|uniref:protein split ends isoform X3 n=1 Tax=Euwallacea fornicatus TaxID=995702 RepID=UPI00338ED71F
MVRETRHLWVGNLPENIREERIREYFKRYVVQLYHCKHCQENHNDCHARDLGYGRVQSVKILPRTPEEKTGEVQMACTVAFMDIKSASKAHNADLKIDDRTLNTKYYEPAAIPSAAAPLSGTPPPYSTSTSPGATRFPNGHGSSDEHGFPDSSGDAGSRFYDRQGSGVGAAPTTAPEGGSGTCRGGRNRDRFRGGGVLRGATSVWGNSATGYADTSRYSNSNERSQSDTTGYSSAPSSDTNDRRNSDSVRKKAKSRSGSRSPSPNGSTSTRSPSRSRSHSSSTSSSSSTSRDTSSTSSRRSRRQRRHYKKNAAQPSGTPSASDDRRPVGIRVSNLPIRSSDTSLKDGLFHEYKKHGKVTWVKVVGQNENRHAIVCFKKPEDAEKALEVSYDKLFFGCKIEVEPHSVCEVDEVDCRYESEVDEYNPKATRTLFIGNLEKDVTASDLREHFEQFGEIIEIDIKKQGLVSLYAFCQYADIVSVVKAIRKMDGEHLGNNRIKLGFGKSMAYNCVWIDGVAETVTEKYLRIQFEPFGTVTKCVIDRDKGQALVFYEHVSQAQMAVNKMRGFVLKNTKLQVDFASRECQECFFERLEKQGAALERTGFEERRDSSARSFEATAPSRISRYDTPTRPRTSSYSSRSSVAAVASPGTPGNATPRARGARPRAYYAEYELEYALEGASRHPAASHRSYDEYSQGSPASHEDPYDPYDHQVQVSYMHDSPGHLDPLEVRVVQNLVETVPYAPHDIRNLQKERVHLLEQLEECQSSGDELLSPKKRIKLDLLDPAVGEVIIEANRDHNRKVKVMEVRRLSESTLRHHSRRPSVDNSKYGHYAPHTVGCKRRRTGGSDGGTRSGTHSHYADHSDGSDLVGSRPGTPLCDENPEFPPGEPPKRTTREREGPMVLPLPKWAAHVRSTSEFLRGTISVAGIKGQKEHVNPLASPPPPTTSPRVMVQPHAVPRPPSPLPHVPPPASPPPRPPSLSSNSSDSDAASGSPSLEERIKSLDEKYEKWSGSRTLSAAGNDALAMLDANREKFRQGHKLLEIQDLKEVQPSDIVKSVMAKRSVFDEDLKRLESVGEKYEPKDFGLFCSRLTTLTTQPSGSTTPNASSVPSLSVMTPTLKLTTSVSAQLPSTLSSPRASSTPIPVSRGLQYPFPSHPPMHISPAQTPPLVTTTALLTPPVSTTSTTVTARNPNLGENRLKPTVNVPGDSRTSSVKNRSVAPVVSDVSSVGKHPKPSEKVATRRNSSCTSPRADVKTRRNSDTSARRIDEKSEEQKLAEKTKEEFEKQRKEQEEKERLEKERIEKEKQERERLEREKKEKERQERESELEKQRLEKERIQKEKERDRIRQEKERAAKLEKERQEKEKEERERRERLEREEKEHLEREAKEEIEKLKAKEEEQRLAKEKEKERRRSEDRTKSKDSTDNHHERNKHRENHSDTSKHRQNNIDKHPIKEEKSSHRDDYAKKDSYRERDSYQEPSNLKIQMEREAERRKESIKENRDNNIHDKSKHINEAKERAVVETRHMSLDLDNKNVSLDPSKDSNRRKERNNSLPANVGLKRRISSHECLETVEEAKKIKHEHKKVSERRDSKDSIKSDKKNRHKNNSISSNGDERRKEKEREERHRHKHKLEKQKSKIKDKEGKESPVEALTPPEPANMIDRDFLAKLNLRSNEDVEKEKQERQKKDSFCSKERRPDVDKRQQKELAKSPQEDKHKQNHKKDRIRKVTNSSDTDSDEPKKSHSIFDIVDDGPAYISMYDKVKARSCKNMQKQEEEKRQEKIKAKFSQLKLSRARREEKKRSTSWDEDSDSDKDTEMKSRRNRKVLDSSDESQDRKSEHKTKETPYNSDPNNSPELRTIKTEPLETTDEDIKVKQRSKSKIASDSSDDEYHKKLNNKTEYRQEKVVPKFFENDTEGEQLEIKSEKLTSVKNELERLVKKERRNSKFQEFSEQRQQSFDSEIKSEKFNNRQMFDTSDDEQMKKDKVEKREKRHKKKQKKQKHSASSEESCKVDADPSLSDVQEKKHHDKRKEHSKKDKKRDKIKDGREKSKKPKKNKSDSKREGKLENIFGSLSEDSDGGSKDQKPEFLADENAQIPSTFNSDSEKETELKSQQERGREEHKRKKEKKRREKERRLQEAAAAAAEEPPNSNENSMDFADMCKQLEANIKDDISEIEFKPEVETSNLETSDTFLFTDQENKKEKDDRKEGKEGKEKKKKRKKSKDEKKHHHHHHHHDKSKTKTVEVKQEEVEPSSIPEIKVENVKVEEKSTPTTPPSLPSLDDIVTSPTVEKPSSEFIISPATRDIAPLISPIPNTPNTSKNKRDTLIPAFGAEIDQSVHENAVKSISVVVEPAVKTEDIKEDGKEESATEPPTDKPRVVISQEETEDAVAALLGESFGGTQFEERYSEEIVNTTEEPVPELVEGQDDEEMRKAVQSLEVDGEISKPDTPQSEHDLQIDTDTEEQEETEQPPAKAVEALPATPYKTLRSPPSLTPIKPQADKENAVQAAPVPDQTRSVISQTWPSESVAPKVTETKIFNAHPAIKVNETNYPPLAKLSASDTKPSFNPPTVLQTPTMVIQQSRHNLPARLPIPGGKPQEGTLSPKPPGVILNRLPITPVQTANPLQPTTVFLPQPKVAHSTEPPKLAELKTERPRMVFHPPYSSFSSGQSPRMVLRPGGLLKPIPPAGHGQYMPHASNYGPVRPDVMKEPIRPPMVLPSYTNAVRTPVPQLVLTTSKSPNFIAPTSPKPLSVITSEPSSRLEIPSPEKRSPITVDPPVPPPVPSPVPPPVIVENKTIEPLHLMVPAVESRTSTPSPVIVANPEAKTDLIPAPVKISIERATEELNLPLEKKAAEEVVKEETNVEPVKEEEIPDKEIVKNEITPDVVVKKDEPEVELSTEKIAPADEATVKAKEEPLENKEDNEFWSAKDSVNIDSVIKTLGSADELSDTENKTPTVEPPKSPVEKTLEKKPLEDQVPIEPKSEEDSVSEPAEEPVLSDPENEQKLETSVPRTSTRRGRGGRGRGTNKVTRVATERAGIQTRRGKLKEAQAQVSPPNKRGRGGKVRPERKSSKSESEAVPSDVYEFREDSDDSNKEQRPRLVLTIKSTVSSTSNAQTTAIVKEITKDGAKEIGKEAKEAPQPPKPSGKELSPTVVVPPPPSPLPEETAKEEFPSPQTTANTRKSRRLAEKDISKNTVDDTIEDVVKNAPLTRAAANQRRSSRQQKKPPVVEDTPRKSPRGRKPLRRASEAAETSSSEEVTKEDIIAQAKVVEVIKPKAVEPVVDKPQLTQPETIKEKKVDHCSLKTAMLKRFKGEMTNAANKPEPTNLIDPVTGMLIPMRESEEGKYIPLPGTLPGDKKALVLTSEALKTQPSVIAQPHQVTVVQQSVPKVHPLKAHVLSSQAAKAVTSEIPSIVPAKLPATSEASPSVVISKPNPPVLLTRSGTPVTSASTMNLQAVGPLSPRPGAPVGDMKQQVKPPMLSPTQQLLLAKHMVQAREQLQAHLTSSMTPKQMMNAQMAHMKHQVIMGKPGGIAKPPIGIVRPQHLPGQIATSPSISKAGIPRVIQPGGTQSPAKGVIESPKVDVNMPNIILGRTNLSPSGPQTRLAGIPVPGYEASLMADARVYYNRTSPPPAHQNSPHSPKGEPIVHFPPGPLRAPELNPAHYMHPQMMYQQFMRPQPFQRTSNLDKSVEEGEEAPVGLTLSGRGAAVPHHSPHDRATESPAIGQVFSTLSARLPYHPAGRYFDQQSAEPPPAHRPLTSHDRAGLPHIPSLTTADRSLGAHSAHLIPDRPTGVIPDRPMTSHLTHDRSPLGSDRPPLSYGPERPLVGAGLVAKYVGVDAPASQRGVQAATPPLASQVPPQADSLCSLLKRYTLLWQGLLALKNDQAAVQMWVMSGNEEVARTSLPKSNDGSTPPLRIFQRMRLEPLQVEGVARKMQMEKEHCMLLALPCGRDQMDVLKQSHNLASGFINYLTTKQAAGIVNVAAPGTTHPPAYVVHIFPSCDFVDEHLRRIAPSVLERVIESNISHLLIVITTV